MWVVICRSSDWKYDLRANWKMCAIKDTYRWFHSTNFKLWINQSRLALFKSPTLMGICELNKWRKHSYSLMPCGSGGGGSGGETCPSDPRLAHLQERHAAWRRASEQERNPVAAPTGSPHLGYMTKNSVWNLVTHSLRFPYFQLSVNINRYNSVHFNFCKFNFSDYCPGAR